MIEAFAARYSFSSTVMGSPPSKSPWYSSGIMSVRSSSTAYSLIV